MTTVERLAKGLFAANLLTAADRSGITPPSTLRIDGAWEGNPNTRQRWTKVAAGILANMPGIDLGAITGGPDEELENGSEPISGAEAFIDGGTSGLWFCVAYCIGFITCGILRYLLP